MLAIRLGNNHYCNCSVGLRIERLHARGSVPRVAGAVKDGLWISLLWLVIKDNDNFALGINPCVVVISQLRRGDAKTGKDCLGGEVNIFGKSAKRLRKLPAFLIPTTRQADERLFAIIAVLDQRNGLQIAAIERGLQSRFGKLRGDPLDGNFVSSL